MMKRIPKGTLKVTTSELDGCEAHEKSKRTSFHKMGLVNVKTPNSIRSFTSPLRSRVADGPTAISPASPATSLGSHHHHSFQFLRRPFGGAANSNRHPRKSSSAAKTLHQTDTCGSSDTGSNNSGVLGISAPPCFLKEGTFMDTATGGPHDLLRDSNSDPALKYDSGRFDAGDSILLRTPYSSHASPVTSPASSSSDDTVSLPTTQEQPSLDSSDGNVRCHPHLLGIHRPCYELPALDSARINLSEEDITKLYEEQESEIVFECAPGSSTKKEKYTLFEQSWLTDSDEDIRREQEQLSPARRQGSSVTPHIRMITSGHDSSHPSKASELPAVLSQARRERSARMVSTKIYTKPKLKHVENHNSITIKSSAPFVSDSDATLPNAAECAKVFVLLLQPDNKVFELIQLTYPVEGTTLGSILEMIPGNATEPVLASQSYLGITRPRKRSPDYCDLTLLASDMPSSANYHSVGLQQGEVVVALPQGFSHLELVRLAKKILSNSRIQGLLERSSAAYKKNPKRSVSDAALESEMEKQEKDYEEGMIRGFAVASVANAAVENDPLRGSDSVTNLSANRKPPLKTFQVGGTTSTLPTFVSRTSLSERQQQAIRGIAVISGASSGSSSSAISSVNRNRRSLASIAKMQNQTVQPSSLGLSSACSVSSSTSGVPGLGKVVEKREDSPIFETSNMKSNTNLRLLTEFRDSSQPGECFHRDLKFAATVSSTSKLAVQQESMFQQSLSKPSLSYAGLPGAAQLKSPSTSSRASLSSIGGRRSPSFVNRFRASTSKSLTSDAGSADRSITSQRTRKHLPRRDSFASFTQRSKVSCTSRAKRQRQRAAFASSLTWGLALLCMTMILRFYTDPQGYYAVAQHRDYNQPLGLLGGLQLFLMLHMLIKFQHAFISGSPDAASEAVSRAPSVGTSPLLFRRQINASPILD